ncbi:MAG: BTAD domain-containing putative transcriptional regulator [Candidatus Binatia bacterium]
MLGGFEARAPSGEPLVFSARKPAALLCYLAFHAGVAQARDKLASLLWEDRAHEQARGSLRQALTTLRRTLPVSALRADGEAVTLANGAVAVDALAFRECLERAALEAAIGLYQGELLEGFHPDAPAFEEWLRAERELLHQQALEALAGLLQHQRTAGQRDPAIRTAVRLLALDPLREDVHRALMTLYAESGQRASALRQYRLCRELLSSELGAQPEPATEELHTNIRAGRLSPAAEAAAAPSGSGAAEVDPPAAELRPVTALCAAFAADVRDPERLRDGVARLRAAAAEHIRQFGGTLIGALGDSVTAVFGVPHARSRDTELAARAALALRDQSGVPVRIGVATGQVMVQHSAGAAPAVLAGSALSDAAALQAAAATGEILASAAVQRAVAARMRCERAGAARWRLTGPTDSGGDAAGLPFVGRRAERRLLESALAACVDDRRGQGVLVRGDAGLGKTRLVEEVARRAETSGVAVHRSALLDFGVGSGRDAVAMLLCSLLDLPARADADDRAAAVASSSLTGALQPRELACLYELLEVPQPAALRPVADALDARGRAHGHAAALSAVLHRAAAERPLMVVVDDVHWADAPTYELLGTLLNAASDCAALIVFCARREGVPADAPWRSGRLRVPFGVVELAPLRDDEAAALAAEFGGVDEAVASECVRRAEGNPLFLEQLLRGVAAGETALPDTVHSLVQARLDGLAPLDRRAAQAASVVGQRFALGTVRHLLARPEYSGDALLDAALVHPDGDELRFCHALVHDGVYASLLDSERIALHRRAAAWFGGRDAVLHAEQLDRAGDPGAADAYREAAEGEASQARFERAVALAERGAALAGFGTLWHNLTCARGDWLLELGRPADALTAFEAARDAGGGDAELCRAAMGIAACLRVLEQPRAALTALDEAAGAAARAGLTAPLATLHYLRGNLHFPLGEIEACLAEHKTALRAARTSGSAFDEARALSGLGDAYYLRGDIGEALRHYERCLALARQHGFGRIEVANLHMHSITLLYHGDAVAALQGVDEAIERTRAIGHRRAEVVARTCACDILLFAGAWEQLAAAGAAIEPLARDLGTASLAVQGVACRGFAAARRGRISEGVALVRSACSAIKGSGTTFIGPTLLGMLAAVTTDAAERAAALAEAERQLAAGTVSHNHFAFRPLAMTACLAAGDPAAVERHCAALEEYSVGPKLFWIRFFSAWGRALAKHARGTGDRAGLERLRAEAVASGLGSAVALLDAALSGR